MNRVLSFRGLFAAVAMVAAAVILLLVAGITGAVGAPGDVVNIGEYPANNGDRCVVQTDNNESVHVGNVMRITTGLAVTEVAGVEDEPGTITVTEVAARGPIRVDVVLAGNITSLEVTVGCVPSEPPVTVTSPPTSVPPTTVVVVDDCVILGIPCETTTTTPPTTLPPTPPETNPPVTTPTFAG